MFNVTKDTIVSPDPATNEKTTDPVTTSTGRRTCLNDFPLFMDVKDVAEMTGYRTAACYALLHTHGCPVYRARGQSRYIVPRDAFYEFLIGLSQQPEDQEAMLYLAK